MLAHNISKIDVEKVVEWLDAQDHKQARNAKDIIQKKSITHFNGWLCDVCDWLAIQAVTVKEAGQAYCLVVDIADIGILKEVN